MAEANIVSIPVRFQDIDSMGHVNNTEYPKFLAEARARYYEAVLDIDLQAADTVVASPNSGRLALRWSTRSELTARPSLRPRPYR